MRMVLRTEILTVALALGLGGAAAQSGSDGTGKANEQQNLVLPPDAAPKPMSPAETETPTKPAAAGGEASDATQSGAPLGAAPKAAMSGSNGSGTGDAAATADGSSETSGAAADQPRNAIGDKFQLPHMTRENQVAIITDICGIQIRNMNRAACTCLADQAMEKLSGPQRDYLIASVVAPPTADQLLRKGNVTKDDQMTIFTFIDTTSETCKTENPAAPETQDGADAVKPGQ